MAHTLPQTPTPAPRKIGDDIVIRRAMAADAEALGAISARLFRETFVDGGFAIPYPPADIEAWLAEAHSPAAYARMLADPKMALWLAEDADGRAVAFATAGPCKFDFPGASPDDGQLYRFYLDAAVQGAGLADRFLAVVLDWLGADRRPVWLGVWSGNARAQRFYARHGFIKVAEFEEPIGQTIDLEFAFRREVSPLPANL